MPYCRKMVNQIANEIEKCIENECFLGALTMALTLPDVCGKAMDPSEKSSKKRYIKWFDTYIGNGQRVPEPYGKNMPYTSGELLYSLRCFMLHQGSPAIDSSEIQEERCKVDHFKLVISNSGISSSANVSHGINYEITSRSLNVNVAMLCDIIAETAKYYYEENRERFDFLRCELLDVRDDEETE